MRKDRTNWNIVASIVLLILITQSDIGLFNLAMFPTNTGLVSAQSDPVWEVVSNEYVSADVSPSDIVFVNETHGWVLSQSEQGLFNGIILHTRDGGDTWSSQLQNASQRYRKIAVIDTDTIWVTCRNGLYYTCDSGDTWNLTIIGEADEPFSFYGVYFINRTHGWTSSNTHLYRTVDAGYSWEMIEAWTFDDWAIMIEFLTPQEGWAMGFIGLYHSTDGGDTWEESLDNGGWTLSFITTTEAWAVGNDWIAKMSDGETWILQPAPRSSPFPHPIAPYYSDIFFLDSEHGWLAGWETPIAYTPNGGLDWYSQDFPNGTHDTQVTSIWFHNLTHGWAVGWGGYIYRTTTGNSLGTRLWMGLSDPIIIMAIGIPTGLLTFLTILLIICKRKRHITKTTSNTVEVS